MPVLKIIENSNLQRPKNFGLDFFFLIFLYIELNYRLLCLKILNHSFMVGKDWSSFSQIFSCLLFSISGSSIRFCFRKQNLNQIENREKEDNFYNEGFPILDNPKKHNEAEDFLNQTQRSVSAVFTYDRWSSKHQHCYALV